ncbi:MAG: tRNA pseudouridine(55) synthase TruB [Oscillospiraceae bacterium]|jgi:tRNA pseudouridine55 synthase|nr:tRNA pseudouridine(55) synthase TruB [Oscillospiraceae bacterium]
MKPGVLLIDKPPGWTSHDVVAKLRGVLRERRIGHTGTLDPMATGLLVCLIGKATRLASLMESNKTYTAGVLFGYVSDTLDITGKMSATGAAQPPPEAVREALKDFTGEITQLPPMVSAVKVGGRRLYDIARKGGSAERKPRPVTVYELGYTDDGQLRVVCSGGTYVRALIDDLGARLGCGAVMRSLRREVSGCFTVDCAVTPENARAEHILPVTAALPQLPAVYDAGEGGEGARWLLDGRGEVAALLRGGKRIDLSGDTA